MTYPEPDWDTVMEQRAEMERDHYRADLAESMVPVACGVTEAELDREQYGRAYVDGEDWNAATEEGS